MEPLRIKRQLPNSPFSQQYDGILLKTGDSLEPIRRLSAPLHLDSSFVSDEQANEFVKRKK